MTLTLTEEALRARRKRAAAQALEDALLDLANHVSDEACNFLRGFADALDNETRERATTYGSNPCAKGDGWDTADQLGLLGAAECPEAAALRAKLKS